ncbi:MAG: 3-hydroxyacyl-CoA dehydrogenase family protein [Fusobacteriaceae bacterium]
MKVGIIGTGTMGAGLVQAIASKNISVLWKGYITNPEDKALPKLDVVLSKLVEKEKITIKEKENIVKNITVVKSYESLRDVDLIIEAVSENIEIKKELFKELSEIISEKTILATNTSSLSITEIASLTKKNKRVIGLHFFNPVPLMKLVEVVPGLNTNQETIDLALNFISRIEKEFVVVKEVPGFVVNRILIPMINEAIGILDEGVATAEEIDKAIKLGANHPIGPLSLADLIGLDICLNIMEVFHKEYGEDKYRPHFLLRKMVKGNRLGRKTGEGFYKY